MRLEVVQRALRQSRYEFGRNGTVLIELSIGSKDVSLAKREYPQHPTWHYWMNALIHGTSRSEIIGYLYMEPSVDTVIYETTHFMQFAKIRVNKKRVGRKNGTSVGPGDIIRVSSPILYKSGPVEMLFSYS